MNTNPHAGSPAPATGPATKAVRHLLSSMSYTLKPRLDISVVWVWNPMLPAPGRYSCRVALLREDHDVIPSPQAAGECVAEDMDDAVVAAVEAFVAKMKEKHLWVAA